VRRAVRVRLAIAFLLAPLIIGGPVLGVMIRDYRVAIAHWDVLLMFFCLPWTAAAVLMLWGRSSEQRGL
jgi:hypothetical protein